MPRWMVLCGVVGVAAAVAAFIVTVLALHHVI
jgi:hypothetical protein